MTYTPSFLEIFVGWCVVVYGASRLGPRMAEPTAARILAALPWITGVAVVLGQLGAVIGLMQQSADSTTPAAAALLHNASFGSAGVVVLALVMELMLAGLHLARRK